MEPPRSYRDECRPPPTLPGWRILARLYSLASFLAMPIESKSTRSLCRQGHGVAGTLRVSGCPKYAESPSSANWAEESLKPSRIVTERVDLPRIHSPISRTYVYLISIDYKVVKWRREWDSNPRYSLKYTRFPSVRLKPLGHLSGGWSVFLNLTYWPLMRTVCWGTRLWARTGSSIFNENEIVYSGISGWFIVRGCSPLDSLPSSAAKFSERDFHGWHFSSRSASFRVWRSPLHRLLRAPPGGARPLCWPAIRRLLRPRLWQRSRRGSNCSSTSAGSSSLATAAIRRAIWGSDSARETLPRRAISSLRRGNSTTRSGAR